jgi:hypothetical protein
MIFQSKCHCIIIYLKTCDDTSFQRGISYASIESPTTLAGNPAEKLVSTLQVPQLGGFKQMNILSIKGQKKFIISYGSSSPHISR